ncbi:hypothetical protein BMR05_03190 [Methylococcaceae bacterium HT4]|uniref:hypothetical protein n=1 Tax=Bathymodiolus platifrons methanotrophic gill symbiont TaxID=113268 RepID=UPI000B41B876|nr:hypothetical protein [Bathymodiolus platifrons methanotrophic gill symbiont]MCK5869107.1 hypothetical protein [Methyloprofundus sp.]TXK98387.1 hypothetical protein BMR10_02585 [Methylococcaceae bacterium CS4]TXL00946.1 hypothetical protein BMR11_01280 [Methylococcaceae bacterium CS5]TXL07007.1 hypothetical protein BMR07_05610 [Methylococcaceae bacterium CS1]TXL08296.1 hypothetical protein BMR09_03265 [Methylococcaceae bacterium CS3]TXL11072.1 hypothetical protein BMR08_05870 [Methylococcac
MLRNFPQAGVAYAHHKRDYTIAAFTFIVTGICLTVDGSGSREMQWALAFFGYLFLALLLSRESKLLRMQVVVALLFATAGELFASPYMEGYIYRFGSVPPYVPAGHGMVYLTAVVLGRSGFFLRYARAIALFTVISCGLWSAWGLSPFAERSDQIGAILSCVYLIYLFKGKSPMVYLGAFFITTWLELVGTTAGTWAWAVVDPASGLTQGNPPSGVAAWYCLVDAVAIAGAAPALRLLQKLSNGMVQFKQLARVRNEK